jgi:hypothetical protein
MIRLSHGRCPAIAIGILEIRSRGCIALFALGLSLPAAQMAKANNPQSNMLSRSDSIGRRSH